MLGTVGQQQQQAAYYAHVAESCCTLSTTAKVFVVVFGIGLFMYLLHYVAGIFCSIPIISGSGVRSSSAVQQIVRTSIACRAAFVLKYLKLLNAVSTTLPTDPRVS